MGLLSHSLSYTGSSPSQAFTTTQLGTAFRASYNLCACLTFSLVTHPSTNPGRGCLTPVIEWELVGATLHWTPDCIHMVFPLRTFRQSCLHVPTIAHNTPVPPGTLSDRSRNDDECHLWYMHLVMYITYFFKDYKMKYAVGNMCKLKCL